MISIPRVDTNNDNKKTVQCKQNVWISYPNENENKHVSHVYIEKNATCIQSI